MVLRIGPAAGNNVVCYLNLAVIIPRQGHEPHGQIRSGPAGRKADRNLGRSGEVNGFGQRWRDVNQPVFGPFSPGKCGAVE